VQLETKTGLLPHGAYIPVEETDTGKRDRCSYVPAQGKSMLQVLVPCVLRAKAEWVDGNQAVQDLPDSKACMDGLLHRKRP
jgi:hypothetical protein